MRPHPRRRRPLCCRQSDRAVSATLRSLLALFAVLALGGCELLGFTDPVVTPPPATDPSQQGGAPATPATLPTPGAADQEELPYERPDYPENAGRNPFAVDIATILPSSVASDEEQERPMEKLERFTLAQLELVSIVSETAVPLVMFIDPDGFGHIAKEGDRIGRQGGVITDIRDNEVDVQEGSVETSTPTSTRTLRLSDSELRSASSDEELSDAERQALERLMRSEEGREQLRGNLLRQIDQQGGLDPGGASGRAQNPGIAPPRAP